MSLKEETITIQNQLATYCRDGKLLDIKGAKKDRLHNYRRLVYNIIEGALSQAYPITVQVLTDDEWEKLVNDFFIQHDPQSTQIWHFPFELYEYVKEVNYQDQLKKPYLVDLLYFEWMEIEVYCMPDQAVPSFEIQPNNDAIPLVINPDYRLIELNFPVHKKNALELEANKGKYFVLIFRQQESGKVQFIELSPFFALVFDAMANEQLTIKQALSAGANALGLNDNPQLIEKGMPFIQALMDKGAVLGYKA